jgi:flagellar M-ring protein FliF
MFRLLELAVIAVLTLIVLLAVVRPMVRRVIGSESHRATGNAVQVAEATATPLSVLPKHAATAHMMEVAKVNGQLRAETVDQVGNMVITNPQETVAVLRNWIHGR